MSKAWLHLELEGFWMWMLYLIKGWVGIEPLEVRLYMCFRRGLIVACALWWDCIVDMREQILGVAMPSWTWR